MFSSVTDGQNERKTKQSYELWRVSLKSPPLPSLWDCNYQSHWANPGKSSQRTCGTQERVSYHAFWRTCCKIKMLLHNSKSVNKNSCVRCLFMVTLNTWSTLRGAWIVIKVACAISNGSNGLQMRWPARLPLTPSTPHGTHISLYTNSCTHRKKVLSIVQ